MAVINHIEYCKVLPDVKPFFSKSHSKSAIVAFGTPVRPFCEKICSCTKLVYLHLGFTVLPSVLYNFSDLCCMGHAIAGVYLTLDIVLQVRVEGGELCVEQLLARRGHRGEEGGRLVRLRREL